MNGKVAIVTGANKGLGFALVKKLCEKFKGTVYLTSRDENKGISACEELKKINLNPVFHQLDVSNEESIEKFRDHVETHHDDGIDLLINNAGVLFLKDAKEPKQDIAEQTVAVNFFALVNLTESLLPLMKNNGIIVNISSSSGHLSRLPSEELRKRFSSSNLTLEELKGLMNSYVEAVKQDKEIEDGWGDAPYVVSKIGVNAYTFLLHRRLADRGIKANCVHPGYVKSDMTRGAGNVSAEEAASVILPLALAPKSSGLYIWHNGAIVPWNGPDPRGYIDGKKDLATK